MNTRISYFAPFMDVVNSAILVLAILMIVGNIALLIIVSAAWGFAVIPILAFVWAYIVCVPCMNSGNRFWADLLCTVVFLVVCGLGLALTRLPVWASAWRIVETGVFMLLAQWFAHRR